MATRRVFLKSAVAGGVALAAGASLFATRKRASNARQVVISGWGGAMQRAMRKAYFEPFTRETGIEVVELSWGGHGLAQIKAQIREGRVSVDLLDGAPFWPHIGRRQGLLDPIVLPSVDASSLIPGALGDYSFGYSTVSWGIGYLERKGQAPRHWEDFWNPRGVSGRRALYGTYIARHLEYALMADGVLPDSVYPLDPLKVDRAMRKVEELKRDITVWYQTIAQCEQLFAGGQVDMAEFVNGRAFALRDHGIPLNFVWNQAVRNTTVFVLAKNAPNRENALAFLSWLAGPEPQARFAQMIYYGPTNPKALDLIDDEKTLERLPTWAPNSEQQIELDVDWWGENFEALSARWSKMISS